MADNKRDEKKTPQNESNEIPPEPQDSNVSVASSRGIMLAAKDSEWIGMRTDFAANGSHDTTIALFPGIQFSDNQESTTVITKLLVGKTADFSHMSKPQRLFISKHLSTVRERSKEEFNPSDSDVSSVVRPDERDASGSDGEIYDDEDEEPKRATHTKRRKKKSDLKVIPGPGETSSVSLIPSVRRKSGSRLRHAEESKRASWAMSNDADDEYQTQSEETICNKAPKKH